MANPEKLGGFKVLREMALICPDTFKPDTKLPAKLFLTIAGKQINLPYITCVFKEPDRWRVNMAVDAKDAQTTGELILKILDKIPVQRSGSAILSIFPHRKKPAVTGALFDAFCRESIHPDVMAHSPSAISVVLDEQVLARASSSLFGPFAFGAYRTPEDWKLAQKGKEKLYKEVVASYQEKRPKVYGLEYQDRQEWLRITLGNSRTGNPGAAFDAFSRQGLDLTFLAASRSRMERGTLDICLPMTKRGSNSETVFRAIPKSQIETHDPVGTFSVNGPHFGDRYGIIGDLLTALENAEINLMGLSCTIASITGVVPSFHLLRTIEAIRNCFDVPSILKIEREYA